MNKAECEVRKTDLRGMKYCSSEKRSQVRMSARQTRSREILIWGDRRKGQDGEAWLRSNHPFNRDDLTSETMEFD